MRSPIWTAPDLKACQGSQLPVSLRSVRRTQRSSTKNYVYRILLVDGMELVRVGLAQTIAAASQLLVCAATGDYDDVPDLIERHRPHLMVAEPFREHRDGIIWIKNLHANHRQMKILVASSNSEATYAERLLRLILCSVANSMSARPLGCPLCTSSLTDRRRTLISLAN